jgi:hypothetical protein
VAVRALRALLSVSVLACLVGAASAQVVPAPDRLPAWAEPAWQALAARHGLALRNRLDPSMQAGDFDGDGRADLAVLVVRIADRKEGIAFLFRARPALIVGAGDAFGNGGDDFSWTDAWHVESRGKARSSRAGRVLRLDGDGLVVDKESSASALIYLDSGRPRWRQYGD